MLAAAVTEHLFWITSRAAGTAALLLSSLAVCVGLLFGGKLVKGRPDLRHLHEALSLATIVALVVHAVIAARRRLPAARASPTSRSRSSAATCGCGRRVGIVAGWAMIALGLSYYVRDRIGQQRWKKLHRFTALAWLAGLAHSFGEGTDAGATWFIVATAIVVVPAFVLLIVRHLGPSSPQPARRTAGEPRGAGAPARHEIARQEIAR